MIRRLVFCLALATIAMLSPTPARSAVGSVTTFDTVDAVEGFTEFDTTRFVGVKVTGIVAGVGTPSTIQFRLINSAFESTFGISSVDLVARCDRMAMLAMSKPGKFQLAFVEAAHFGPTFNCRLLVRTP